jgi:hypothetical protein
MKIRWDSWPVLGIAAVLVAVISCVAATTTTPTTTTTTSNGWTTTMVASSATGLSTTSATHSTTYAPYYTPFPFSTVLQASYTVPTLTTKTSIDARSRYLFATVANQYLTIGTPSATVATTASSTSMASGATVTYTALLSEVFEAVTESSSSSAFRLDSELHALYSLDVGSDGTTLVFHNNWGTATSPTGRGYLLFTYDGTTKRLTVAGRVAYDPTTYTHTAVSSYAKTGYEVAVSGSTWSLATSGNGTELTVSASPVSVATPTDFYPEATEYQWNTRVALASSYLSTSNGDLAGVVAGVDSAYASQVATAGTDASTAAAASTMLDTIATSLAAEGASLRYDKKVYLAFREALLATLLKSDDIANGVYGMQVVPYVYFTNATDGGTSSSPTGTHHPFLVIASYSLTDKPNRLVDVRRPPGDGTTDSYATQSVTRDATLGKYLIKIPLRDYGLTTSLSDNTYVKSLKSDAGSSDTDSVYNLASISGLGVMVDGSPIYPVFNNTLVPSQKNAELTSIGNHVGRGMELHYHADGHIALNNDLQVYNINDYAGQSHPPLIGFGLDGIALYGVYESAYPSMDGVSTTLDAWGGHTHGSYGYHYHSHIISATTTAGIAYKIEALINGAWKGKINDIPTFWEANGSGKPWYAGDQSASTSTAKRYVGVTY